MRIIRNCKLECRAEAETLTAGRDWLMERLKSRGAYAATVAALALGAFILPCDAVRADGAVGFLETVKKHVTLTLPWRITATRIPMPLSSPRSRPVRS